MCTRPLRAYQCSSGEVVFQERAGRDSVRSLDLACGQCWECRLERSRQWAVRCVHEASLHDRNSFVTLTYAPEKLPPGATLRYRDFQLFMKRLRKYFSPERVRFFMGGEYGEIGLRPHYHSLLFGVDFADRVLVRRPAGGSELFVSKILDDLWGMGSCTVGDVTFESAAYVARYAMKKITGAAAPGHYGYVDKETGEVHQRVPEFCHMSLDPGIGRNWIRLYWRDVLQRGEVIVRGKAVAAPKFYLKYLKGLDGFAQVVHRRELAARARGLAGHNTDERLAVRDQVVAARISTLKRRL